MSQTSVGVLKIRTLVSNGVRCPKIYFEKNKKRKGNERGKFMTKDKRSKTKTKQLSSSDFRWANNSSTDAMTIVKSNKKRSKWQQSIASMICYAFLLICLVVGVLVVLCYEDETIQRGDKSHVMNKKKNHHIHHSSKGKQDDDDGLVNSRRKDYTLKRGLEGIISGDLHLISLSGGVGHSSSKPYAVHGTFCHLDWFRHKDKPSSVPMNKDLIHQSDHCDKTKVSLDLYEVVTKARNYDEKAQQQAAPAVVVTTMEPKGFVFHESRCGSTLVANSLAAFNPERNRVYSESAPPITAAKMYDPNNKSNSLQLLRDVVYMMGKCEE